MKQHCPKCRMSFRLDKPIPGATVCRCSTPDCRIKFWHGTTRATKDKVVVGIVGIFPEKERV
jgi:hypothetical protein